jgi:hypothetical protein
MAGTVIGETLETLVPLNDRSCVDRRRLRRLALFGALSALAVLVNPYGPRLLTVPFETGGGSFVRLIEEWMPPDLRVASFWPFAVMLVLLLVSVGVSPARLGWTEATLCSAAVLLAVTAGRNISLFAVVAAPVIARHASAFSAERGWELRPLQRANMILVVANVLLILCTVFVAANRLSDSIRDSTYRAAARQTLPVDAVEYLRKRGPRGRLFNAYEWGGYVMHEMPQVRVFVDGRSDLYGGDFLINPYLVTAEGSPGWERELDRYKIGTVLVSRTGGLANALAASSDWRWAYADDRAVVFERR